MFLFLFFGSPIQVQCTYCTLPKLASWLINVIIQLSPTLLKMLYSTCTCSYNFRRFMVMQPLRGAQKTNPSTSTSIYIHNLCILLLLKCTHLSYWAILNSAIFHLQILVWWSCICTLYMYVAYLLYFLLPTRIQKISYCIGQTWFTNNPWSYV